ncbi:hypothetical protein LLEC1_06425 [Akanthomyces lecanii]|uniref:Subtilisin-like serine protease n=1 Tax=Cordyceps confragosa TaxID=2714763 RepID=A0A179IK07_CORDF|nr:hypothetical protein LLEC1_06425 [Akanthomyces lecanii]
MSGYGQIRAGIARPEKSSPPFTIELLHEASDPPGSGTRHDHDKYNSLLPATYRTETGELVAAGRHVKLCIGQELDLQRLTDVHDWLWFAGLPRLPRPLHHQLLIGHEIVITERLDMHLVWTTGRLFLKPIPRYLLEPSFWTENLNCALGCACAHDGKLATQTTTTFCHSQTLRRRALGFLFSYAALVSHESDFRSAQAKLLLPSEVRWLDWRVFVDELDLEHIYSRIDPRFYHAELRLSRLNILYAALRTPFRGYVPLWNQYGLFIRDNFAWLAGATVYIAIVLTAMQVGLVTESLAHSSSFQAASYGFTVFSILGPLITAALIIIASICVLIVNIIRALRFTDRRIAKINSQGREYSSGQRS